MYFYTFMIDISLIIDYFLQNVIFQEDKMRKITVILITVLFCCSLLFAAGSKEAGKTGYVFGSDCTWPPLEYVDENGQIVGFEIDLVAAISAKSGIPMTHRNVAWDGIFAGLTNGAYDAIASGVTITKERMEVMDFTDPTMEVVQSIIMNNGVAPIDSAAGLIGRKVGVQLGTTGHIALEKTAGINIKAYDEIGLAVEDLLNKNLDAVVCDSIIAADFVLTNDNYKGKLLVTGSASTEVEQLALVVEKGNTELLKILNDGIKALKEDGTMAALKKKWNIL